MWGWFTSLESWQRHYLVSEVLSTISLVFLVAVFVGPTDWRTPLLITAGTAGVLAFLAERRAWAGLVDRYPDTKPPTWLRGEWPDDGRHVYLRFVGLRWLGSTIYQVARDRLRVILERRRSRSPD